MKGMKKVAGRVGKVTLALLAGIFMPILVWVALGVALNQKLQAKKARQAAVPTIGEILRRRA